MSILRLSNNFSTTTKNGGEHSCSGRINSSCSTSDTCRVKVRVSCALVSFSPVNGRSPAVVLAHILQFIPVHCEIIFCVLVLSREYFGSH